MARGDKGYQRRSTASGKAAATDAEAKRALQAKMSRKGGGGKLTRAEIKLARRMGQGEGQS